MIQRVMVGYLTLLLIITLVVLPHNSHQTYFNTGDGYKFQQETAEYINNNRDDLLDKIREQRGKVVAVHELKMGESSSSSTKSEELTSGNPFVKRSKQTKTTKRTKWAADQFVTIDALETTDGTTEKDGLEQVILEEFNSDSDFDMAVDDLDTMDLLKYMNNLHKWKSTNVNLDTTLTWLVELEQKLLTHNETTTEIMDKTDVDFKRMIAELEAAKNETCRLQQEVIAHKLQLENTRKEKEYLEKLQRLKQSYELYIQHHNTTTKLWEDYMEQKKDAEKKIEQIEQKLSVIQELKTHIFNIKQRHKLLSIWFAKWKKLVEETDFTIIIPGENATDITINNHTQIIYSNETTVDKIYHKYIDEYENPLIDGNCFCPVAFEPVCGSDGITYSSLCVARCAQVQVMYKSACRCKEEHVDPEEHAQAGANVLYIL